MNRVLLNHEKFKELRISFLKRERLFSPIVINGENIKVVDSAKLLGVTISSDLTWNAYVSEVIKKAAKRIYFLTQFKRANVSQSDLCLFYASCLRSVFHYALTKNLAYELERIQKRAMRIICPSKDYQQALLSQNLPTIQDHHDEICTRTFNSIIKTETISLHILYRKHLKVDLT